MLIAGQRFRLNLPTAEHNYSRGALGAGLEPTARYAGPHGVSLAQSANAVAAGTSRLAASPVRTGPRRVITSVVRRTGA